MTGEEAKAYILKEHPDF